MKYFTPERWVRLQNIADERHFHAAQGEWGRALNDYRNDLENYWPQLPARLRAFAQRECLHDALILGSWRRGSSLFILLDPSPPSSALFLVQYSGVESSRLSDSGLPTEYRTSQPGWKYDEFGVESEHPRNERAGRVFTHSILLSNGWELCIRFRGFQFSRPEAWLPLPNTLILTTSSASPQPA